MNLVPTINNSKANHAGSNPPKCIDIMLVLVETFSCKKTDERKALEERELAKKK